MTIDAILFAFSAVALAVAWRWDVVIRRRRHEAELLAAHTRGYAQAHDDIYEALVGTPDEAHRRLGREAARQRPRSRLQ